jgi:hypothetical protein
VCMYAMMICCMTHNPLDPLRAISSMPRRLHLRSFHRDANYTACHTRRPAHTIINSPAFFSYLNDQKTPPRLFGQ